MDPRRPKSFHDRAVQFIPRLPLPEGRYWIGVLIIGAGQKITSEKQFIWMKGTRNTTVETVWRTFSKSAAMEDFVLLLDFERVEFRDRMEELDYSNDKKIVFRAVKTNDPDANGQELCPLPALGADAAEVSSERPMID